MNSRPLGWSHCVGYSNKVNAGRRGTLQPNNPSSGRESLFFIIGRISEVQDDQYYLSTSDTRASVVTALTSEIAL